ncbi:MAG TPA: hypothetical protein VGI10_07750 [Polyangiaceae bacterium]|jgi:uncharacterized protein YigA (DUF484 family)
MIDPHHDCRALAESVVIALGVNGAHHKETAIMEHAIANEVIHLRLLERLLEQHQDSLDLSDALYLAQSVRQRLELAGECAGILASLLGTKSEATNG